MSALQIEALLQPLSADAPCGANMEYEPPFLELQELARGKPEQVIGDDVKPAQEPKWSEVLDSAAALFGKTKDLRVAGVLYVALVKERGVEGLVSGLGLLRGLLERHWEHVHPQLDPDDDNDPIFRVNSLVATLANEDALNTLRLAPLAASRQFGRVSLRNHRIATGTIKPGAKDGESPDAAQEQSRIDAVFADVSVESLSGAAALLNEANGHLNAILQVLLQKADGIPEDVKPLLTDIKEMQSLLAAHLTKRGVAAPAQEGAAASPQAGAVSAAAVPGVIRNSTDVLAALQRICEYYARSEPSSPVPLLLQRAARLVNKDFMEILRDLAPGGVGEAEVIGGLERRDR
jgi:type VI secretion system protein ImpA